MSVGFSYFYIIKVALRKESVDRNWFFAALKGRAKPVALRKESVDRNVFGFGAKLVHSLSLSARRAWIEMSWLLSSVSDSLVALRKESVDRNVFGFGAKLVHSLSLSARRAWIEIFFSRSPFAMFRCRSPQGERG